MYPAPSALLSLFLAVAVADNTFIAPPESTATIAPSRNPVYAVGDELPIRWTDNFGSVNLIINQVGSPSTQIDYLPDSTRIIGSSYNWPIRIDGVNSSPRFDLLFSNQFNLILFETGATSPFATSITFNISNATVDAVGRIRPSTSTITLSSTLTITSTRTSSNSASTTTSSSSGGTSSTNSATSGTSGTSGALPGQTDTTTPPSDDTSGGLSTGAKAGIGVGVSLGVIGAGLAIFAVIWVRRRKASEDAPPTPVWANPDQSGPTTNYPVISAKYANDGPPQELGGRDATPELHNKESHPQRYELQ